MCNLIQRLREPTNVEVAIAVGVFTRIQYAVKRERILVGEGFEQPQVAVWSGGYDQRSMIGVECVIAGFAGGSQNLRDPGGGESLRFVQHDSERVVTVDIQLVKIAGNRSR